MTTEDRTTGILIWSIIGFIAGAVFLIIGIMALAGILYTMVIDVLNNPIFDALASIIALVEPFITPINIILGGVVLLVIGILMILSGIGLFLVKPWGRMLAIITGIIMAITIVGIILVWYMFKEDTKAAFGVM